MLAAETVMMVCDVAEIIMSLVAGFSVVFSGALFAAESMAKSVFLFEHNTVELVISIVHNVLKSKYCFQVVTFLTQH